VLLEVGDSTYVKAINLRILSVGVVGQGIPLPHKQIQITMHILFKLSDTFCRKCMRNCLSLPGVLGAISSVEKTSLD
jgi:hypothetical protein